MPEHNRERDPQFISEGDGDDALFEWLQDDEGLPKATWGVEGRDFDFARFFAKGAFCAA